MIFAELLRNLFRVPGLDTHKRWMFPRILLFFYKINVIFTLVFAIAGFIGIIYQSLHLDCPGVLPVLRLLVVGIFALFLVVGILLLGLRMQYEFCLCVFRIFQSQRQMAQMLGASLEVEVNEEPDDVDYEE